MPVELGGRGGNSTAKTYFPKKAITNKRKLVCSCGGPLKELVRRISTNDINSEYKFLKWEGYYKSSLCFKTFKFLKTTKNITEENSHTHTHDSNRNAAEKHTPLKNFHCIEMFRKKIRFLRRFQFCY